MNRLRDNLLLLLTIFFAGLACFAPEINRDRLTVLVVLHFTVLRDFTADGLHLTGLRGFDDTLDLARTFFRTGLGAIFFTTFGFVSFMWYFANIALIARVFVPVCFPAPFFSLEIKALQLTLTTLSRSFPLADLNLRTLVSFFICCWSSSSAMNFTFFNLGTISINWVCLFLANGKSKTLKLRLPTFKSPFFSL